MKAQYKSLVKKIPISAYHKTKQKAYLTQGCLPIIDQGQKLIGGYSDDLSKATQCELPVIVFGDHTCCVKYIDFPFGAGADGIKVLQPHKNLFPKYLYYGTQYLVLNLRNRGYGRHYQHLEKLEIFLPPLPEQRRIVARIEALFSDLDNGVATLRTTKRLLGLYRQSVLKEAFDRAFNEDGVRQLSIEELLTKTRRGMATGPFGTMIKKSDHRHSGVPMLGIENIGNGNFVDGNKIFVTQEKALELDKYKLFENDIIVSRSGTIGEICSVPKRMEGALLSTNLMRISLDTNVIDHEYFISLFQSKSVVLDQIKELCKGSTRDFLTQNILKRIIFPVPSVQKQQAIVADIHARFSLCSQIEQTVDAALQKSDALRQSILKQAFEGRL